MADSRKATSTKERRKPLSSGRVLDRIIRRYTNLSKALDTLANRRLVLVDPARWDDTNDSYFLELYRAESQIGSVVALCSTRAPETYHHWRVFTEGSEGICIELNRIALENALSEIPNVIARPVEYLFVKELQEFTPADLSRLPFVKRDGFQDEKEWRIIGSCDDPLQKALSVPIELSWINRLVLNPWMPLPLVDNLRSLIRAIPGCAELRVESSRLTNSKKWKDAGKRICKLGTR